MTIVVLASMIFVLSAMIGYLYWQQTRLHQNLQSLGLVVSTLVNRSHEVQEEVVEELLEQQFAALAANNMTLDQVQFDIFVLF